MKNNSFFNFSPIKFFVWPTQVKNNFDGNRFSGPRIFFRTIKRGKTKPDGSRNTFLRRKRNRWLRRLGSDLFEYVSFRACAISPRGTHYTTHGRRGEEDIADTRRRDLDSGKSLKVS